MTKTKDKKIKDKSKRHALKTKHRARKETQKNK